jgi:hypothetical protein
VKPRTPDQDLLERALAHWTKWQKQAGREFPIEQGVERPGPAFAREVLLRDPRILNRYRSGRFPVPEEVRDKLTKLLAVEALTNPQEEVHHE